MRTARFACIMLLASLGFLALPGCATEAADRPDFSDVRNITELASLDCYYHNVVRYHKDADGWFFGIGNIGEKNYWFEYDGIVELGLDVGKVAVSEPDASNIVTITIPPVQILGHPDIDEDSMTNPLESNGWFTSMSADEKTRALAGAQENLVETANNDEAAKLQSKERAKKILEQYVKNVGKAIGQEYSVEWNEIE